MKINLYDVLSVKDKEESYEAVFHKKQVGFQGEVLTIESKEPFLVNISHTDKAFVCVSLEAVVTVVRQCSRCLADVSAEYRMAVNRTIDVEKEQTRTEKADEYDEVSYIEDCTLDVDMLILDELYTLLPMTVLCKEDCKGICKVCGINLNQSTCDCDQAVPDPRMAVFSDIFNQFKEV